eukprot:g17431.t1
MPDGTGESQGAGRWNPSECEAFAAALAEHGRNYERISNAMGTRTAKQIRSHYQKYARKHGLGGYGAANPPAPNPAPNPTQQAGTPATYESARTGNMNERLENKKRKIKTRKRSNKRVRQQRRGAGIDGGASPGESRGRDGGAGKRKRVGDGDAAGAGAGAGDAGAGAGAGAGGDSSGEEGGEDDEEEEEEEDFDDDGESFIPLSAKAKPAKPSADSSSRRSLRPPWYRASSVETGYPLRTLHNEVLDLCDLLLPTPDEKLKTATALTYVKKVVSETLGDRPRVQVFGSQLTGLVLPSSDIDTVVLDAPTDAITRLGQAMYRRQNQGQVREVSVIKKAKGRRRRL